VALDREAESHLFSSGGEHDTTASRQVAGAVTNSASGYDSALDRGGRGIYIHKQNYDTGRSPQVAALHRGGRGLHNNSHSNNNNNYGARKALRGAATPTGGVISTIV